MDETMLTFTASSRVKVFTPKDIPYPVVTKQPEIEWHITLVVCVAADGSHAPTTTILPLKTFPAGCEDIVGDFCWAGQSAGWMTTDIFESWVETVFVPHLCQMRDANDLWHEPALLWLDGHSSRRSQRAIEFLRDNNVIVGVIPAHSSHILQPLDVGVNGVFKQAFKRLRRTVPGSSTSQKRRDLLGTAHRAMHEALYPRTVRSAWEKSGLCPWAPSRLLADEARVPQTSTTTTDTPKRKTDRSWVSISGCVLTGVHVQEGLERSRKKQKTD